VPEKRAASPADVRRILVIHYTTVSKVIKEMED
jgi:hypothetical protein